MLYSFQKDLLFCHVARTGGVSVSRALSQSVPDFRSLLSQHASLAEARQELGEGFSAAYKLAVVRNPWDRLVSWRAFLAGVTADPEANISALADPDAPHWQDFDAFLEEIASDRVHIDGQQVPEFSQFHQLSDAHCRLLTDRIIRFERLAEDIPLVMADIGLKVPPLPHKNGSHHLPYQSYYSDAGRELVAEAFADDLRAFGYRFDALTQAEQLP